MIDNCAGCLRQLSIEMHHPFNGPDRKVSERIRKEEHIDLRVPLCSYCHRRAHEDNSYNLFWKRKLTQMLIDKGWTKDKLLRTFRKYYGED